jgi:hypothetical protein
MSEERRRILAMVAEGKVSVHEAETLLDAVGDLSSTGRSAPADPSRKRKLSFLRVEVKSAKEDNVNVRVPLNLVRAGIKLTTLIPQSAMKHIDEEMHKHGMKFDLGSIKTEDVEEFIQGLADMQVDVDSKDGDKVRVWAE